MSEMGLAPPPKDTAPRSLPRLGAVGLGIILVAAVGPRLAALPKVLSGGEILQWDGDSAYHLKRILHAVASFPDLPRFDPAMNWPSGAVCPWADGFDLLGAAWALCAGLGDPARTQMAVLLFTPILALFAIWATVDLARLVLPADAAREPAALAAGLLIAFAPTAVYQSQVGFLDHHIAELLSFLLLAGWALRRIPTIGDPASCGAAWELAGALLATFALWVFSGGALYVAAAAALVAVGVVRDERPRLVGSGAPAVGLAFVGVLILSLPALRTHGILLTYRLPSLLQPLLLAAASVALGLAWASTRLARGLFWRSALLAAAFLVLAASAAASWPGAVREVLAGLQGWLLRRDPWIAAISEFQPLGADPDGVLAHLIANHGVLGVAGPLILAAGGWIATKTTGPRGAAFSLLASLFVLLTLHQVRFERIGQPLLMIFFAVLLAALARKAASPSLPAARFLPVLVAPILLATDPSLRGAVTPDWVRIPPTVTAALALRDCGARPGYEGALTSWDDGHLVSVLSGVGTPTNGFGPYLDPMAFAEAQAVLTSDGEALDRYMDDRRVRYVVAGALSRTLNTVRGRFPFRPAGAPRGAVLDLDYMKGFGLAPLLIGGSAIPGAGVHHIERLMPVFATPEQSAGLAFAIPALWIFERVPGAKLVGKAAPGRRVIASLELREQGRPHVWKAFADADADGSFEMTVPLPTNLVRHAFTSGPRYALRVDEGPATEAEVPEGIVRSGGTIRVGAVAVGPRPPELSLP